MVRHEGLPVVLPDVSVGDDSGLRPQVAREIIAAGLDLLELQPLNLSLEEIFLQLTRDEADAAAPSVAETTAASVEEAPTAEGESL